MAVGGAGRAGSKARLGSGWGDHTGLVVGVKGSRIGVGPSPYRGLSKASSMSPVRPHSMQ